MMRPSVPFAFGIAEFSLHGDPVVPILEYLFLVRFECCFVFFGLFRWTYQGFVRQSDSEFFGVSPLARVR